MACFSRTNMAIISADLKFSAGNLMSIYCNALAAEAVRSDSSFERQRNWRILATGAEFSICDITVQTFPVPHGAGRSARIRVSRRLRQPRIHYRSRLRDQIDR